MSPVPLPRLALRSQRTVSSNNRPSPEGSAFHDKVKLRSYRTQEAGGLVFAYFGPDPAPLLPIYDVLTMTEGVKEVRLQVIHANWFNHVENVVDISHLAWLHGYTFPGYGGRQRVVSLGSQAVRCR